MTDQVKSFFSKYGEWARLIVFVAVVILQLWASNNFVTKADFEKSTTSSDMRLRKVEEIIIRMESGAVTDTRHDAVLADHETRIRNLERKCP